MMKKLSFTIIILLSITCYSQNMEIVWQECYGTELGDENPRFVCNTKNGYYISTTISSNQPGISNYHGGGDAWLIYTDTLHNIIWERCYGGSSNDSFIKMLQMEDGNSWIIGYSNSTDGDAQCPVSYPSFWILKIDSTGTIISQNCFGNCVTICDGVITDDGGLILVGHVPMGIADGWICKIDSYANIIWEKNYGTTFAMDRFFGITETSKNTWLISGMHYEPGEIVECDVDSSIHYKDVWLVEIDDNGEILWQSCYGGSFHEQAASIIELEDGYIFVASTSSNDIDVSGNHSGETDIWLVKIDYFGNIIWQNCYGGSNNDYPVSMFITSDDFIVILGSASSHDGDVTGLHGESNPDIWFLKTDMEGNLIYNKCFGSAGFERYTSSLVAKIDDYNYIVASEKGHIGGDIECHLNPNPHQGSDAWVFHIKDCEYYAPAIPQKPTGIDTLCINTDTVTSYATIRAKNAWYYEWEIQPRIAGTILNNTLTTDIRWNPEYEGSITLKVRSHNDCGTSEWSDSLSIYTYVCLGSKELLFGSNLITVYPNPANKLLNVKYNEADCFQPVSVELLNMYGIIKVKQVLKRPEQNAVLNIESVPQGIYYVVVKSNDKIIGVKKVIIE